MLKKNPRDARYPEDNDMYENDRSSGATPGYDSNPQQYDRNRGQEPQQPAAPAQPAARMESVVDVHSSFDGRFETDQDLRIEGAISGEVICRGRFTVERDATARTKIQANEAHIKGRLEGDIVCSGTLVIAGTAVVSGTMKAATLVVEEGASLSGTVETVKSPTPAPISRAAAATATPAPAPRTERPTIATDANATVDAPTPVRSTRTREVPSFALVSSEPDGGVRN